MESQQIIRSGGSILESRRKCIGRGNTRRTRGPGKSKSAVKCPDSERTCVHFHTKRKGQRRCRLSTNEMCVHFHRKGSLARHGKRRRH